MAKSKLEIDKEQMFNKIMPSATRTKKTKKPTTTRHSDDTSADISDDLSADIDEEIDETEEFNDTQANIITEASSAQSYSESLKNSIEQILKPTVRQPDFITPPTPINTTVKQVVIHNLTQQIVAERLEEALDKFNCCKCQHCQKDVMAIALNKLRPHYIVLPQNAPPPIPDQKVITEVTTALIQSTIRVKAHPRHDIVKKI